MGVDYAADKATQAPWGVGLLPLARAMTTKNAGCVSRLSRQQHFHERNQVVRCRLSPPRPRREHRNGQQGSQAILKKRRLPRIVAGAQVGCAYGHRQCAEEACHNVLVPLSLTFLNRRGVNHSQRRLSHGLIRERRA